MRAPCISAFYRVLVLRLATRCPLPPTPLLPSPFLLLLPLARFGLKLLPVRDNEGSTLDSLTLGSTAPPCPAAR